jgi:hypothetical protein
MLHGTSPTSLTYQPDLGLWPQVGAIHYGLLCLLSFTTGVATSALPSSVQEHHPTKHGAIILSAANRNLNSRCRQFPCWELSSVLGLWSPIATTITLAFARHATDTPEDDAAVLVASVVVFLIFQVTIPPYLDQGQAPPSNAAPRK